MRLREALGRAAGLEEQLDRVMLEVADILEDISGRVGGGGDLLRAEIDAIRWTHSPDNDLNKSLSLYQDYLQALLDGDGEALENAKSALSRLGPTAA